VGVDLALIDGGISTMTAHVESRMSLVLGSDN
jgi:hypothetical protein